MKFILRINMNNAVFDDGNERARWSAVLGTTGRPVLRVTRKTGMLEKITDAAALAAIAAPMLALCTVPGLYHFFYM